MSRATKKPDGKKNLETRHEEKGYAEQLEDRIERMEKEGEGPITSYTTRYLKYTPGIEISGLSTSGTLIIISSVTLTPRCYTLVREKEEGGSVCVLSRGFWLSVCGN